MDILFKKIFRRIDFQNHELKLPFSVRSVGHHSFDQDHSEYKKGRNFVQFFWMIKGKAHIVLDGKEYIVEPQQVFYYLTNEEHIMQTIEAPWEYRWFTLDGNMADSIMLGFNYQREPFWAGNCPEHLFKILEKRIHNAIVAEARDLTTAAWQILVSAGSGENIPGHENEILQKFFSLVQENFFNEAIDVNALSETLHLHRTTLSRIMRKHTSTSPGKYLSDFRLLKSLEMLQNTNTPICEVATACGISDPGYFARVIHKKVNCTPLAYRQKYRD